jgi:SAM-dependent methyltransferase
MALPTARQETQYWERVADTWRQDHRDRLWRRHSDAVNGLLCARWLGGRIDRLLKTDAFDEAVADGLVPLLASRARVVIGIDIATATLTSARRRSPSLRASAADVRRLPFPDGAFDAAVSLSTLDHFPSHAGLRTGLRELARVLRPAGRLVLTLDNPANPVVGLRNALPFEPLRRLGLVPYYVGATCRPVPLRAVLDEVGFDVLETTAVLHCPRVLCVAAARVLARVATDRMQARFLAALAAFERLGAWPTRYVTGHFTAVLASRRA